MQPKKKSVDYKKYFSNELKDLLEKMMSSMLLENPVSEISTEFFLMFALETYDCMLYKALNSFLNSITINNIHDDYFIKIQDSTLSAIRPGRTIDYSAEFSNFLSKSYEEKEKMGCKYITSDHILLAILNDKQENDIKKHFIECNATYDILFDKSRNLHEITEEIIPQIEIITDDDIFNIKPQQQKTKKSSNKGQVSFCKNLNLIAESSVIDRLIGRDKEIKKIEKVFARRKSNNVILVGASGVGKTALVEGLAKRIVDDVCPLSLRESKIYSLNFGELLSGTNLRGMFEDRVGKVFSDLKSHPKSILFIDDAHLLINEKKNDDYGFIELINEHVVNNDIKIILATDEKGYKNIIQSGKNILRNFQRIDVESLSEEETFNVINGISQYYENYHKVSFSENILKDIIALSKRYITEVPLPASAIDIIDEVGAILKVRHDNIDVEDLMKELSNLRTEKDLAIKKDDIETSKSIDVKIKERTLELSKKFQTIKEDEKKIKPVKIEDVYTAISEHTNIPVSKLNVNEKETLMNINQTLNDVVIGQTDAINKICNAIKRSKVGLYPSNRPIYVAMLLGSTGIGKSLTAKMLAKEIFGDEKYLVRFDMSEYADKTSVNKLIGSSAGYVGYDNGGLLTEAIKNKKHAVLLIDEIEKADVEVYNIFLQVFDDGFLTDNMGNKVDFKNTIILLTSNIGAKTASMATSMGFNCDNKNKKQEIINKELKNRFPPEFINRLDDVIFYNELMDGDIKKIIRLEMNKLSERVNNIGYDFAYDDEIVDYIFNFAKLEKSYGARPIIRIIQNKIETKITDYLLTTNDITSIKISLNGDEIKIAG